jgi:hypothetical protein
VVAVEAAAVHVSPAPVEVVMLEFEAVEVDVAEFAVIEVAGETYFDEKAVAVDPVEGSLAVVRKLFSAPPYTSAASAVVAAADAATVVAAEVVDVAVVEVGRN